MGVTGDPGGAEVPSIFSGKRIDGAEVDAAGRVRGTAAAAGVPLELRLKAEVTRVRMVLTGIAKVKLVVRELKEMERPKDYVAADVFFVTA